MISDNNIIRNYRYSIGYRSQLLFMTESNSLHISYVELNMTLYQGAHTRTDTHVQTHTHKHTYTNILSKYSFMSNQKFPVHVPELVCDPLCIDMVWWEGFDGEREAGSREGKLNCGCWCMYDWWEEKKVGVERERERRGRLVEMK